MKIRALLLIAIMIMGTYAMIQVFLGYDKKEVTELLGATKSPFSLHDLFGTIPFRCHP